MSKTIVYANTIDYNHPLQQRPHHLMNELAKRGYKIHWINQTKLPYRYKTIINENLTVFHDWEKYLKNNADNVDIYFSSWSERWVDIDKLSPKMVIYDSLDLFPQNEKDEIKMANIADVILTTTNNIKDYHVNNFPEKPIYMCENGCFTKYRNIDYPIPDEFKNKSKPIVLFSGALATNSKDGWVDFEIVKEVAKNFKLYTVGLNWNMEKTQKLELDKLGVIFLGEKSYDELQSYYAHCDVNILPFKRCQIADYSFPLKVVEGCNFGKPCVATNIPVVEEFYNEFPKSVLVSKNKRSFISNIHTAINKRNNEEYILDCYNLADKHSWDSKVDIIENVIKKHYKED